MQKTEFETGAPLAGRSSMKREGHRNKMQAHIVEEARRLLQHEGYASFSLRKVATAAGVALGTLQHYFPNRTLLLNAVVTSTVGSFNRTYQEISRYALVGTERLTSLLEQNLRDIFDRGTASFMLEIAALANHEWVVAVTLADSYRAYLSLLSRLIGEVGAGMSEQERHVRAVLIASQLDGLLLVLHSAKTVGGILDGTLQDAIHILLESISHAR
ncbi:MAG: TetR/AcrR family transcriptional regulator [Paraburkholderia fungorum]|nr:TetR/AcrR family transcriptional regulator [Paraburkholderia fungorum]